MRIACLGNMNGIMLAPCKYLSDFGHDVTLFLLDEYSHFNPVNNELFRSIKIVKLGWNKKKFSEISKSQIKQIFKQFDFFIATDCGPAYLFKASIKTNIFFPAGTDLSNWPFESFKNKLKTTWQFQEMIYSRCQLLGIKHSKAISLNYSNDIFEKALMKIGIKGRRILALPLFHPTDSIFKKRNKKSDKKSQFTIIQQGRQAWGLQVENIHNKGNDILIKGFKLFLDNLGNPEGVKLNLFNYGESVDKTKKLIKSLGLETNVEWISKCHRSEVYQFISQADICVGNLYFGGFYNNSVLESLALGVPFLGYRKDSKFSTHYEELYPMINANTPELISEKLLYYYENKIELSKIGKQGKEWLLNYQFKRSLKHLKDELSLANTNNNIKHKDVTLIGLKVGLTLSKVTFKLRNLLLLASK